MKHKKLSLKSVIIPLIVILVYFVSEYVFLRFGKFDIPKDLKFVVIILCICIAGGNAYKQYKTSHL